MACQNSRKASELGFYSRPSCSSASYASRLCGLVLLARLELVRVLQLAERASTAPGVQRTGEVAVSVAVAVWDEDPGHRAAKPGPRARGDRVCMAPVAGARGSAEPFDLSQGS
ncbi:MAG TPA: hypothetical protein VN969_40125 [Streptosporangiaceae bacterium]|nr:hypothetical protein [Streptosporangiaceae bacterium]